VSLELLQGRFVAVLQLQNRHGSYGGVVDRDRARAGGERRLEDTRDHPSGVYLHRDGTASEGSVANRLDEIEGLIASPHTSINLARLPVGAGLLLWLSKLTRSQVGMQL
jgi:hypothetical protein